MINEKSLPQKDILRLFARFISIENITYILCCSTKFPCFVPRPFSVLLVPIQFARLLRPFLPLLIIIIIIIFRME
jgi:hypothetical protein